MHLFKLLANNTLLLVLLLCLANTCTAVKMWIKRGFKHLVKISENISFICFRAVNHPEYPTVLQALDIENPVVANCLIDMRGIETILLIKVRHFSICLRCLPTTFIAVWSPFNAFWFLPQNARDARRVMQGGHPPHNCREAFTREGDQVYYNRYYSSDQHRATYLSRDVEEDIRYEVLT